MKSKPGAAMVEMADGYAVDRAITHLNNNFMFGQKLNVWWVSPPSLFPSAWRVLAALGQLALEGNRPPHPHPNPCSVSKQQAIMPGQSYGLEDGSCSYKDFSGSRNNRFSTPEQAAKNRIQHPSNVLHFFNAPLEVTEDNFYEVRGCLPWTALPGASRCYQTLEGVSYLGCKGSWSPSRACVALQPPSLQGVSPEPHGMSGLC